MGKQNATAIPSTSSIPPMLPLWQDAEKRFTELTRAGFNRAGNGGANTASAPVATATKY